MAISFADESALPQKSTENEFTAVIEFLAKNPNAVKSYVVSEKTEAESRAKAAYDKRKMSEAGNALPDGARTVRTTDELLDDGKSVKVYIRVMPYKINRGKSVKNGAETPVEKATTKATTK